MTATLVLPDVYFLPEWGRLFAAHDQGEACQFEFRSASGRVYYQFVKRRVPEVGATGLYYDIVTPYGFNGPVVLAGDPSDRQRLVQDYDAAFREFCFEQDIIAEYVRFSPWLRNHVDFGSLYSLRYRNSTLYTDLTVDDWFMHEFHSKTRNQVRKARKSGVRVQFDFHGSTIAEFSRLYDLTVRKNDITEYYQFKKGFLERSFRLLSGKLFAISAMYEGACVSCAMFVHHGHYMHYHLSANDPNHYPLCANSLILAEACSWGVRNAKKQLHLGGAFSEELLAFKKQFTRSGVCDYYAGSRVLDENAYRELVNLRLRHGPIRDNGFFPLYRG